MRTQRSALWQGAFHIEQNREGGLLSCPSLPPVKFLSSISRMGKPVATSPPTYPRRRSSIPTPVDQLARLDEPQAHPHARGVRQPNRAGVRTANLTITWKRREGAGWTAATSGEAVSGGADVSANKLTGVTSSCHLPVLCDAQTRKRASVRKRSSTLHITAAATAPTGGTSPPRRSARLHRGIKVTRTGSGTACWRALVRTSPSPASMVRMAAGQCNSMFTYAKQGMDWGTINTLPEIVGLALQRTDIRYLCGRRLRGRVAWVWRRLYQDQGRGRAGGIGRLPFINYESAPTSA